jgi:serine/threonine protein kinase
MHALGIFHLDIKTANMFVENPYTVEEFLKLGYFDDYFTDMNVYFIDFNFACSRPFLGK